VESTPTQAAARPAAGIHLHPPHLTSHGGLVSRGPAPCGLVSWRPGQHGSRQAWDHSSVLSSVLYGDARSAVQCTVLPLAGPGARSRSTSRHPCGPSPPPADGSKDSVGEEQLSSHFTSLSLFGRALAGASASAPAAAVSNACFRKDSA
jgi:hypothetical protein